MAHVGKGTRYYSEQVNRHGTPVYYYRRPGFPRIQLKAEPGTTAMDRAFYAAEKATDALAAAKAEAKASGKPVEPERPKIICKPSTNPEYIRRFGDVAEPGAEGTLQWLVDLYLESDVVQSLDVDTMASNRRLLRRCCAMRTKDGKDRYGDFLIDTLEPLHIRAMRDQLKDQPGNADNLVAHLRGMFSWAILARKFRGSNPTLGVEKIRDSDGHHTWTEAQLQQYRDRWSVGTVARTTFELLFFAGLRISDAWQVGPFHVKEKGTALHWKEFKGGRSKAMRNAPPPKPRELELHPDLAYVLQHAPHAHGRYMITKDGEPFKNRHRASEAFKRWAKAAGLPPECMAHGVRKSAASLIFEASQSEAELCATFGWVVGSPMPKIYAEKFNRRRASKRAVSRLPSMRAVEQEQENVANAR